ncbi:hypothetical protein ACFQ4E_20280, partial [Litorisediminicola beolgyonensis]
MTAQADPSRKPRRRLWALLVALPVLLVALAAMAIERPLPLPDWARDRLEAAVEARLPGLDLDSQGMELFLGRDGVLRVRLDGLRLASAEGRELVSLAGATARLDATALLGGRVELRDLALSGAVLTLDRDAEGRLSLGFAPVG